MSRYIADFLRMWMVGWNWCPRRSVVSTKRSAHFHQRVNFHQCRHDGYKPLCAAPCTTWAGTAPASAPLLQIIGRCMWLIIWRTSLSQGRAGRSHTNQPNGISWQRLTLPFACVTVWPDSFHKYFWLYLAIKQEHDDRVRPLQSRSGKEASARPVHAGRQQLRRCHLSWRPRDRQESVRAVQTGLCKQK